MDYIISVLLGIVGNLLTPSAKRLLRWPAEAPNDPTLLAPVASGELEVDDATKEQIRAYNRARLSRASWIIWIHGFTFFLLFAAFYLPLMWKPAPGQDVQLVTTRLAPIGDWSFKSDRLVALSLLLALLFYVPLWLVSQPIGRFIAGLWDQLYRVTPKRYMSLIVLSFFALTLLVAGHWIYLLYPSQSYLGALMLPIVLFFVVGYFGHARR